MDTNFQMPDADKNRPIAEKQNLDQTKINQTRIELSNQAINRLARILADIAENSTSNSKEATKHNNNE